jgi:hypothetical protein
VLAFAAVLVPMAGAADTNAPKGARLDWLPTDTWVMSGWMPFDEARLDAASPPTRFRTLRDSAMTPLTIGARGGRSAGHVRGAL